MISSPVYFQHVPVTTSDTGTWVKTRLINRLYHVVPIPNFASWKLAYITIYFRMPYHTDVNLPANLYVEAEGSPSFYNHTVHARIGVATFGDRSPTDAPKLLMCFEPYGFDFTANSIGGVLNYATFINSIRDYKVYVDSDPYPDVWSEPSPFDDPHYVSFHKNPENSAQQPRSHGGAAVFTFERYYHSYYKEVWGTMGITWPHGVGEANYEHNSLAHLNFPGTDMGFVIGSYLGCGVCEEFLESIYGYFDHYFIEICLPHGIYIEMPIIRFGTL